MICTCLGSIHSILIFDFCVKHPWLGLVLRTIIVRWKVGRPGISSILAKFWICCSYIQILAKTYGTFFLKRQEGSKPLPIIYLNKKKESSHYKCFLGNKERKKENPKNYKNHPSELIHPSKKGICLKLTRCKSKVNSFLKEVRHWPIEGWIPWKI